MLRGVFRFIWRESPIFLIVYVPLLIAVGTLDGVGAALVLPILDTLNATEGNEKSVPFIEAITFLNVDPTILNLVSFVAAIVVVKATLIFSQRYFAFRTGLSYERRAKTEIFSNIAMSTWTYMQDQTAGKIVNTSLVEAQRSRTVFSEASEVAASSMFVVAYALIGLWIAPTTFGFGIVVGVAFASIYVLINRRVLRLGKDVTDNNFTVQDYLTDTLQGLKFIKSTAIASRVVVKYGKLLRSIELNWREYFAFLSLSGAFGEPLSVAILLTVLLFHFSTTQDFNSFLAVAFILFRMQGRVNAGFNRLQILLNLVPALDVVEQLRGESRRHLETTGTQPYERLQEGIELRDVGFGHTESSVILDGCDITFEMGKTTALVGPSGSGKTTIIDLVLGLYEPDAGTVLVDTVPLAVLDVESYRRAIGIVPQEPVLFNDTIHNNICLAKPDATTEEVVAAAKMAFAHEFIYGMKDGYKALVGERGLKLSGGQRQRIALARALLAAPDILILDEATSALDLESEERIKAAMRELHGQMTIIIIAHRPTTIEGADRIYRVVGGRCQVIEGSESRLPTPDKAIDIKNTGST